MSILPHLALAAFTALADPVDDAESRAQAAFDDMARNYPALNATVMIGDEIVWEAEGGSKRSARDGVETDYNVYSVAKMMTGMAFARLEAVEGLDLNRPVTDFDPELPDAYADVTLRQLLAHTGGVRHYDGGSDWSDFAERRCDAPSDALPHFIGDPLRSRPGDTFQYSTFGFALLSHALMRATGAATFDGAMRHALGETYLGRTDREGADKAENFEKFLWMWRPIRDVSAECKFGGGGVLASSRDLARMLAALYDGAIVAPDRLADVFTPITPGDGADSGYSYGMSFGYAEELGAHYAAHSGGSPGGRAFMIVLIEPKVAVALTGNFDGPPLGELAQSLAGWFAGTPVEDFER